MEGEIVMNIKITSKELEATDAIKDYIEKKSEKLEKYFGEDFDVYATIKTEGTQKVAEMNIKTTTEDLRAVTAHRDLYASIDKDIDTLEGQIRKMKTKKDKQKHAIKFTNNTPKKGHQPQPNPTQTKPSKSSPAPAGEKQHYTTTPNQHKPTNHETKHTCV